MLKNKRSKIVVMVMAAILFCFQLNPMMANAKAAESMMQRDQLLEKKFASGGETHTHQYIVNQALAILEKDKGHSSFHNTANAITLSTYADWPDKLGNETDYGTYAGHFYNPYTEKSYTGSKKTHALARAVSHYEEAVTAYKEGNVTEAFEELGKGVHYVADINEPHHASNLTAVNSNHTKFEKYVDENLNLFHIAGNTISKSYYKEVKTTSIEQIIKNGAFYAYALKEKAQDKDTYFEAANLSVQHGIINAVQYFYAFGVEVGIYK